MFLSTHCNAHSALDGQGDLHYLLIFLISREIFFVKFGFIIYKIL